MRIPLFVLASVIAGTESFCALPFLSTRQKASFSQTLCFSTDDDDDDWYSDYDPSVYDSYNRNYDNKYQNDGYQSHRRSQRRDIRQDSFGLGHDYARDTSRDDSKVDEDAVNQLLAERLQARKLGNYDKADDIRDQLMEQYSVGVFDRDRKWRTGLSPSFRKKTGRRARNFGRNGHDYNPCPDAGPNTSSLTEKQIHQALAERLKCKLKGDFQTADIMQYNMEDAGIFVHDGLKQWRADGVPFGDFGESSGGGKPRKSQGSRSTIRSYTRSEHSEPLGDVEEHLVEEMVRERSLYKSRRQYDSADTIRNELIRRFNVHVDDKTHEWSAGGDFGRENPYKPNKKYVASESSMPVDQGVRAHIQQQVEVRAQAKRDRDFKLADSIRDTLLEDYCVFVHDKLKQWSVGGNFDSHDRKQRLLAGQYTRRGGGHLDQPQVLKVISTLALRFRARQEENMQLADKLQDFLKEEFNVIVDDYNREWRIDSEEYVPYHEGTKSLTLEEIEFIQMKLKERTMYKQNEQYEEADAIRDELIDKYSVAIEDRTKEWRVISPLTPENVDKELDLVLKKSYSPSINGVDVDDEESDDDDETSLMQLNSDMETAGDQIEERFDSLLQSTLDEDSQPSADNVEASQHDMSREELMSLTVVQLKEKLRESGKAVSGRKAELVDRLLSV